MTLEEQLKSMKIGRQKLAKDIHVPVSLVNAVIKGEEAILSQKTEKTILVCSDRNVICVLGGEDISEDDIIKIGENIVFFFEEHN